jgi:hypothetical protein
MRPCQAQPVPILGRFTSKLVSSAQQLPRANRPASYGPIQFNFENKQAKTDDDDDDDDDDDYVRGRAAHGPVGVAVASLRLEA